MRDIVIKNINSGTIGWNLTQQFEKSPQYKRLINELEVEEDRAFVSVGKFIDFLVENYTQEK